MKSRSEEIIRHSSAEELFEFAMGFLNEKHEVFRNEAKAIEFLTAAADKGSEDAAELLKKLGSSEHEAE